jgi:hypothetical protein
MSQEKRDPSDVMTVDRKSSRRDLLKRALIGLGASVILQPNGGVLGLGLGPDTPKKGKTLPKVITIPKGGKRLPKVITLPKGGKTLPKVITLPKGGKTTTKKSGKDAPRKPKIKIND